MAKTKKSMRALAFIITVMMIACLAPTVSFAANTVTMDDIVADGNSITVGGSIEKGAELTMLAVRANAELTSLSGMSDADLEKAIMYIDQVTMGDEKYTKTFELRDSAEGNVITVFMGGTDAAMVYKSYKTLKPAGTVTINGTDFVAGTTEPKLTVSDADEYWFPSLLKKVYVKGDEEKTSAGTVDNDGTITIDTPSNEKKTYVVDITTPDGSDYNPYTNTFEFTYITAEGDKISKLPTDLGVTVDKDSDASKYTITIPADDNGIVYSATVGSAVQDLTTTRTFNVTRPADNGDTIVDEIIVVVTATAGTAKKDYTIRVLEQGAAAPAIDASYVAFASFDGEPWTDVYGVDGAKIVEIAVPADVFAAGEKTVKIGDKELFYSPLRDKYVGTIVGYADGAAVAEAAVIEDKDPTKVYYGYVTDPIHEFYADEDPVELADVMRALAIKNLGIEKSGATELELISADVDQDGEILLSDVMKILAGKNSGATSFGIGE